MRRSAIVLSSVCVSVWSIGCAPVPHAPVPIASRLVFSVSAITQPEPSRLGGGAWSAPGFDLDGTDGGSLPCTAALDFVSERTGDAIDNQYANAVGTLAYAYSDEVPPSVDDVQMAVAEQIASGAWSLVVVVEGIDDGWADDVVAVRAVRSFRVGAEHHVESELGRTIGRIDEGRLVFALGSLPLPFGEPIGVQTIDRVQVAALVSERGLTEGEIGGALSMSTVHSVILELVPMADFTTSEALAQPDLDPDRAGEHCGALSLGVGFTAEPVVLFE